jgi:DNA-binding transcriptional LysR family regulator
MWPKTEPLPEDLQSTLLKDDRLIAVQARGLKVGGSIPFLSFSTGGALGEALKKTVAKLGAKIKLTTVFESPSSEVLLSMASAGFGVAYVPASLCAKTRGLLELPWPKISVEMRLFRTTDALPDRIESIWKGSHQKAAQDIE